MWWMAIQTESPIRSHFSYPFFQPLRKEKPKKIKYIKLFSAAPSDYEDDFEKLIYE